MIRRSLAVVAALASLVIFACGGASSARAALAGRTDVLMLFDTTGSMGGALDGAKAQAADIVAQLRARLGDVAFGVAQVEDYPVSPYGETEDQPWHVVTPVTSSDATVISGINSLELGFGSDPPEAYGGALDAALRGDGLGWRDGARRIVVLIADNVPHDDDLNAGVPASIAPPGVIWNTEPDLGPDQIAGTADDIDWQALLSRMKAGGLALGMVVYKGVDPTYLAYWNHWAGLTGGSAVAADDSDVAGKIVTMASQTAEARTSASDYPIVFVHGVMGAKLACDGDELWPDIGFGGGPELDDLALQADGATDVKKDCSGPVVVDGLFRNLLGGAMDVHGGFVDWLAFYAGPGRVTSYAYDWRKRLTSAADGLDAHIDTVLRDTGARKVTLIGHSMGGMVSQIYINDPGRASKVARLLTMGTPFWGAVKPWALHAHGQASPDFDPLDALIDNEDAMRLAVNSPALLALLPSRQYTDLGSGSGRARQTGWLTVTSLGSRALKYDQVFGSGYATVGPFGVNRALVDDMIRMRSANFTGFRANGVDFRAVVGTGVATPNAVVERYDPGERSWVGTWGHGDGDGTVPIESQIQGYWGGRSAGEAIPMSTVCGVSHAGMMTDRPLLERILPFVLRGEAIPAAPDCPARGDTQIDFTFPRLNAPSAAGGTPSGLSALRVILPGETTERPLEQAGSAVQVESEGRRRASLLVRDGVRIVATRTPITVSTRHWVAAAGTATPGRAQSFLPTKGKVIVGSGTTAVVTANGRRLRPRAADRTPPRTSIAARRSGSAIAITVRPRDASRVTGTYLLIGRSPGRRINGTIRIPASKASRARIQSVDVFGNIELPRRIPFAR